MQLQLLILQLLNLRKKVPLRTRKGIFSVIGYFYAKLLVRLFSFQVEDCLMEVLGTVMRMKILMP